MKICTGILMIIFTLGSATHSLGLSDGKEDKILNKHKEIISNAAPDDWLTLAKSAEFCLRKNINRKEVAGWIDKSIAIKATAFNLEVKGDYYTINHLPQKAGEYYLKAIQIGTNQDPDFDATSLQEKIATIINLDINSQL